MASIKYWEDCVDPADIRSLWSHAQVRGEWKSAGELTGHKVHMSRNLEGNPFLTSVEVRAVAEITVERHFKRVIDVDMICAIVEIESFRRPMEYSEDPKSKDARRGLMQILESKADWLINTMGYQAYATNWTPSMLYRPFVNLYYGAAYLKVLSMDGDVQKKEEYIVKAYHLGPKYINKKSSVEYWHRYLEVKQSLKPPVQQLDVAMSKSECFPKQPFLIKLWGRLVPSRDKSKTIIKPKKQWKYWEERVSPEDMAEMWKNPIVKKQWNRDLKRGTKSNKELSNKEVEEKRVRFSLDEESHPCLTKLELKAVADIVVSKHFANRGVTAAMLCALCELSTQRRVNSPNGIMNTPYSTSMKLYAELSYKAYELQSVEDLSQPFVSLYFGAAYVCWLLKYQGRPRSDQFVVQAYRSGPEVTTSEAGTFWLKYLDALPDYLPQSKSSGQGACSIQ